MFNATIWMKNENEKFDGIRVNKKGEIEKTGKILIEDYQNIEKVKKLIGLGFIQSLKSNISEINVEDEKRNYKDIFIEQIDNMLEDFNYFFIDGEWFCQHEENEIEKVEDILKKF